MGVGVVQPRDSSPDNGKIDGWKKIHSPTLAQGADKGGTGLI